MIKKDLFQILLTSFLRDSPTCVLYGHFPKPLLKTVVNLVPQIIKMTGSVNMFLNYIPPTNQINNTRDLSVKEIMNPVVMSMRQIVIFPIKSPIVQ